MKSYPSPVLHMKVTEERWTPPKGLPLFVRKEYEIRHFILNDIPVLFIRPLDKITVSALAKQRSTIETATGLRCVLFDEGLSRYRRDRLIELGIPFYFGSGSIYLPFMGISLGKEKTAVLPDINVFTPVTQKMVLTSIYGKWERLSTAEVADAMKFSRPTAARCLLELQALELPLVKMDGKTKYFSNKMTVRETYSVCERYFQSPVAREIFLESVPKDVHCYGGISTVAAYSMLADNEYPTYAVTKREWQNMEAKPVDPLNDKIACAVHVVRYLIESGGHIDPISAVLSVPDIDRGDPRISHAIVEVVEDVLNG